ncbi:hypothetical protein Cgig2_013319 [Carnegiea gigantea]|uniref:Reverse transcriptase n=1 Tax=Carnegiea gigantea TaxID=171969 RepID=A0A9Q1GHK7_9CARY|nr:hypothetical protein Cgig2_013319 [Carnegiea gigantea]
MWTALQNWAETMDAPWCILADLNSVLHPGERMVGIEVSEGEIKSFADRITQSGLQEFLYVGTFFTWTNKSIWSRIDIALYNEYWHDTFDFTHFHFLIQGLSDHSLISLSFPHCPKPKYSFLFCDMWTRDGHRCAQLQHDPCNPHLQQQEEIARNHYVEINQSALSLFKQQSKADWITYGVDYSRVFMVKIKQRMVMTNIYTIRNHLDQWVEGFDAVFGVMTAFYKTLLGTKDPSRIPLAQHAITKKKDSLWVQWIHERYLRGKEIWDYTSKGDTSWY